MIRIKISFVIIVLIIVLGISGFFVLKQKTNDVIELIDETKAFSDSENTEKALDSVEILMEKWDKFHTYASVFINNEKISVAQSSIARLKSLIEEKSDEVSAELETAKSALKWIIESEIPRWTNIL